MITTRVIISPQDYTVGDTLPVLRGVITDQEKPTDLTGYTVTLHVKRLGTTVLTKTASIDNAAQGKFSVTFGASDLVVGVCQEAEIQFVAAGGSTLTWGPVYLNVRGQIA